LVLLGTGKIMVGIKQKQMSDVVIGDDHMIIKTTEKFSSTTKKDAVF
jgi:hypothetical protein